MLNLSNLPTEATMRLTKCTPRRDGAGIAWDVELAMEVPDEQGAQLVEGYVPGALAVYHARESSKGDVKTSGGFDMLRCSFVSANGERLARGHCEVKAVLCKAHAQQAVLVVRLRLFGLLLEAAMQVVEQLDEQVQLQLEDGSGQLSLLPQAQALPSLEGQLVVHTAGDTVLAGIVHSQQGSLLQLATMEHADFQRLDLGGKRPDSCLQVVPPDGHSLRDLMVGYVERCDAARVPASWLDVVSALGQLHAEGSVAARPDFAWELAPAVWDAAFIIASAPVN